MIRFRRNYLISKLFVLLLVGLLVWPTGHAGAYDLQQGFDLPGGQTQCGDFSLSAVAGMPGAGRSTGGDYTLLAGLVFSCRGVELSTTSINVSEGGDAASYTLCLLTQPAADVVINITGDAQLDISPATLTFTAANWSIPQTVSVAAVNDDLSQGARDVVISHTAASTDPAYNSITIGGVTAHISDNDSPGITITESGGSTTFVEGGSDSYQMFLGSQPTDSVTATVYGAAGLNVSPASLVFTTGDWYIPQEVTVSTPDDSIPQGSRDLSVSQIVYSADPQYNALIIPDVIAHILDNDSPGVNIIQSGGTTEVTEGEPPDSYQINLSTIPSADVSVGISVYASCPIQISSSSLTFTAVNWDSFQTVEITVPDDSIVEGDRAADISHTVSTCDPDYNGISAAGVSVIIHDDDIPGLLISESNGNTVVNEGGSGDSYTLALKTQPADDVTINISSSNQIIISPFTLVFTSANWDQPQTVTVTAVDDSDVEGLHQAAITLLAQSSDGDYQSLTLPLQVSIIDNDASSDSSSDGDNGSTIESTPVNSSTGSADVAPQAGGTISLDGEVTLNMPPGALGGSSPLKLEITRIISPPAVPAGYRILGDSYRFTVGGAEHYRFGKPIQVIFTYDSDTVYLNENPGVYYFDDVRGDWVSVGGAVSDGTVGVTLDHFTKFAVMVKEQITFTDITGHWAENNIKYLTSRGVIAGYPDGTFKPDKTITRAEFTTVLVKAFKLESQSGKVFKDASSHWARDFIATAAAHGIVNGYDNDTFGPDDPITREQMVLMAVKAAQIAEATGETSFNDNDKISFWAIGSMLSAVKSKIISGYPNNTFIPQGNATRAEAVSVILSLTK